MIKTILVAATGGDRDEAVFAAALAVARPFSAHLEILHVRIDAAALAVTMASEGGGSPLVGGLVDRLEEEADRREQRSRELFERFCAGSGLAVVEAPPGPSGLSAQWLREVGAEPFWITEHGRTTDLVVLGRGAEDGGGTAPETIEAALIDSGRPVLIPPSQGMTELPQTIVIGWKARREAAHAVTAALPFLDRAREVRIVTVAEAEDQSSHEGSQLMTNLRWRGLAVTAERLHPEDGVDPAVTLVNAAAERGALLVMGGYGHSRLREWLFGGFTRHVLEQATGVPVLIVH
jgi:nucleotide-binding universal stress UspA family protein